MMKEASSVPNAAARVARTGERELRACVRDALAVTIEMDPDSGRARAVSDGARSVGARAEAGDGSANPVESDARPGGSNARADDSDTVAFERESEVNATDSL